MDNLTIRKKLGVVFTLLILVFLGASVYAVIALKNINDGAMRIATTHLHSVLAASDNGAAMTEYRALEYAVVTAPTLKSRAYSEKKACSRHPPDCRILHPRRRRIPTPSHAAKAARMRCSASMTRWRVLTRTP